MRSMWPGVLLATGPVPVARISPFIQVALVVSPSPSCPTSRLQVSSHEEDAGGLVTHHLRLREGELVRQAEWALNGCQFG
jgi:hypothetical protein